MSAIKIIPPARAKAIAQIDELISQEKSALAALDVERKRIKERFWTLQFVKLFLEKHS
jgi:hypothetical protein